MAAPEFDRVVRTTKGESSLEKDHCDKRAAENDETGRDLKCIEENSSTADSTMENREEERPQQKNKKRCWKCKAKLELAQRELGICKCGMDGFINLIETGIK